MLISLQGYTVDKQFTADRCLPGRHSSATFGVKEFVAKLKKTWDPKRLTFPVVYLDFYFWNDTYASMRADSKDGASYDVFIKVNIPQLVETYGTEAVFLPFAPPVINALNSDGAVEALNKCGLVERTLLQAPEENLLYVASCMCNKMCNKNHTNETREPDTELDTCVGEDMRFKWVVLQKAVTDWGVDVSDAVMNPKVARK